MKTIQSIELEDEEEKVGKEILGLIVEFCLHHHRFKYMRVIFHSHIFLYLALMTYYWASS